jgi:hexosaminidase
MDPVTPEMTAEQAALVLGGQCNLWSEVIYASRIAEYMLFPRLCAIAEALWSPKDVRSLDSFARRLPAHRKKLDELDVNQFRGPLS